MYVPTPTAGFFVSTYSGQLAGAQALVKDIDLYFRLAFIEMTFNPDGGLLIAADGVPWNSANCFDTDENLAYWFEGVAEISARPSSPVYVWAWEESECELTILRNGLVQLTDPAARLRPVSFRLHELVSAVLLAGRELQDLQAHVQGRLEQLRAEPMRRNVPRTAWEWAKEIPERYLREKVKPMGKSLVEVEGMSVQDRWKQALEVRMSPGPLHRIGKSLDEIESRLDSA